MHKSTKGPRRLAPAKRWAVPVVLFLGSMILTPWTASVAGAQDPQDPPFPDVLRELNLATSYWSAFGDDTIDYTFSYTESCDCPSSPQITVKVVNREVDHVTTSDGSSVSDPRTVESIFDEIRGHLDAPAASLEARFHGGSGYPIDFFVDPDDMTAGDEYGVTVSSVTLARTQRVQEALSAAEQRWEAAGAAGDHYVLTFRERCFMCLPDLYTTVTVVDDQAVEATDSLDREAFWRAETVESLFERIRDSTQDVARISASFDETYGYPTSFYFHPAPWIFDIDTGFEVTEHIPLGDVPVPDVDVQVQCIGEDGRIDLLIDSNNPADGPIDYAIEIGTVESRTRQLLGGVTHREFASGRYDALHDVKVRLDGLTVWYRVVTVECDPARAAEVEVETTCLGENGRVDVYLTNPGPPQVNVTDDIYRVEIGSLPDRYVRLYPGDLTARVTATGRPDGPLTVVVIKDYVEISRMELMIGCDVETDVVQLATSCLQFNGRVDVTVFNGGPVQATYEIGFTGLADRTRAVSAQRSETITYTGRPDGSFIVEVRRDGVVIAVETVTIGCDR